MADWQLMVKKLVHLVLMTFLSRGNGMDTPCQGDQFLIFTNRVSQPTARTNCVTEGGTLARIDNTPTFNLITDFIRAKNLESTGNGDSSIDYWIGKLDLI